MAKYHIDSSKIYDFPDNISIINHKEKILIIAPEEAIWIVLDSTRQQYVFNLFHSGLSIEEVLKISSIDSSDVNFVVTQIEARKFYKSSSNIQRVDRTMHLYLTNKCNLSCPHCYMFSGKAEGNELNTQEIKKLISDFAKISNGTSITFSGGEPTIRNDFDEIIRTAYELGLEVKILTNGTQLSSERISAISKYISSVQISIDGFSEKSNSLVRGKGNFAKALAAVDTFISNGVYTSIAITPSLDSLRKYMDKYIEFALVLTQKYENNAFELRFSEELLNGRSISNAENINSEYKELMSKVQKELYGSDYKLWEFVKTLTDNPKITNCSFGNICVNSIGDVFLCPRISDLKSIGNIRTKEFKDINHEADIAESLTSIINLIPCSTCDLRYICGGGCRIEEYPGLTYRETFVGLNPNEYPRQECNNNQKKIFYDLMIESNEYFYSDLNEE
ncbi:radical SAM protein [Phocaeicola barnesiae]|uniref:radical SAM/SPASM domain-containing protein n=1 Tax=Phocaeicola barnesiae TaxID=376804 RepID=UPI0025A48681|nr:radical SAM protein [Phocaeicola barnesiae]MDM8242812.1 radical SAM protein [Phocaeicola barnesiae]